MYSPNKSLKNTIFMAIFYKKGKKRLINCGLFAKTCII